MVSARTLLPLAALLWVTGACSEKAPRPQRAHVVLISIDTLRPDHLGCYGHARDTSPHMDAIAAKGIVFEQAHSHSSRTAPAHMTMLTGLLPEAHGVVNFDTDGNTRLPDDVPTLASHLAGQGYRTVAVTAGGNVKSTMGFDRGFESWTEIPHGPGDVEAIFDAGLAALEQAPGQDLFLFLHTYAVHDPYVPPEEFSAPFLDPDYDGAIPSSPAALAALAGPEWIDQHRAYWSRVDPEAPADVRRLRDLYDGAIARVDAQIGRLGTALERLGQRRRTLFVITSDHGEEFGEHGGFQHGTLYEECLRVPLILLPPPAAGARFGVQMPARIEEPFGLVDLMPTLLELLRLPVPDDVQGRSRWPLLLGVQGSAPQLAASYPRRGLASLRLGDLKLIHDAGRVESELYDLAVDPGERDDLAWHRADLHRDLLEQLRRLQAESARRLEALGGAADATLDDETRRHLQALGYLGATDTGGPR